MTGIDKVIAAAGTQAALAKQEGVSQQIVSRWVSRGYVPSSRVVGLSATYGIPKAELIDPRLRDLLDVE